MLRNILYLVPVFLLVGAGCVIGNVTADSTDREKVVVREVSEKESHSEGGTTPVNIMIGENGGVSIAEVDAVTEISIEDNLPPLIVSMKSGNFFFDPPLISAKPGQEVEIHVERNQGLHTFVIDELNLKQQITDGTVFRFTAPSNEGDYSFYCDIGEHRKLGMEGILRVTE